MTSLLDIGDITRKVPIRGKEIEVSPISGEMFLGLLQRFPELRALMAGASVEVSPAQMMKAVPEAVGVIIAAATGTPNNKEAEEKARSLGVGEQAELIRQIWELTFPQGVQSFIEALAALSNQVGVSGWDQVTQSPGQSNNSSQAATPSTASGNTAQE